MIAENPGRANPDTGGHAGGAQPYDIPLPDMPPASQRDSEPETSRPADVEAPPTGNADGEQDSVSGLSAAGGDLSDAHLSMLVEGGISRAYVHRRADAGLLRSVRVGDRLPEKLASMDWLKPDNRPGILFGSEDVSEEVSWQLRPDNPPRSVDGRVHKYIAEPDSPNYGVLRRSRRGPVLIVEGTKQSLAAAAALEACDVDDDLRDVTLIGIRGCYGWRRDGVIDTDLAELCAGREVGVALDADAAVNFQVYSAGLELKKALHRTAESVEFLQLPGRKNKAGLDDLLAPIPEAGRRAKLVSWWNLRQALPAAKKPHQKTAASWGLDGGGFTAWDPATGHLLPEDTAKHIINQHHWALTSESAQLARYVDGVYIIDHDGLLLTVDICTVLGNTYGPGHGTSIATMVRALCAQRPRIPVRPTEPLMCCENGLLDLRTLELRPHTPAFKTLRKVPVRWDPGATAPHWVEWAHHQLGAQQLTCLEERASAMLDPSTTPNQAIELFGPARTGKSTVGRVLESLVMSHQVSAVTLQDMSDDRFAAADLYGKALNIGADLSKSHINDSSLFKRLTGNDVIRGNIKHVKSFEFRNQALMVFSCNAIPTVSEQSDAYFQRICPIALPRTYAGKTDQRIEDRILAELPGILVRLVTAWHAVYRRAEVDPSKRWTPVPAAVLAQFRTGSDRVARFASACCKTGVTTGGDPDAEVGMGTNGPSTGKQILDAFNRWAEQEGLTKMGKKSLLDRIRRVPGVTEVRIGADYTRGFSLEILEEDAWGEPADETSLLLTHLFGADVAAEQAAYQLERAQQEAVEASYPPRPAAGPNSPVSDDAYSDGPPDEPPSGSPLLDGVIALVRDRARRPSSALWSALTKCESGELPPRAFKAQLEKIQAQTPQLTVQEVAEKFDVSAEVALPLLRLVALRLAGELAMYELVFRRDDKGKIARFDPTTYLDTEAKKAAKKACLPAYAAFMILNRPASERTDS